jgi:fatty-acyl-CoA synthase
VVAGRDPAAIDRMLSVDAAPTFSLVSDTPLLGETIGSNFERTVARFADREALVDVPTNRRWTCSELDVEVDEFALGLLDRGIAKGDRVGILAPNGAEWVIAQYATAKVGAILVNVNPAYRPHELRYVIGQSGMRMLIAAQRHKASDYRGMVEGVRGDCPHLEHALPPQHPQQRLLRGRDGRLHRGGPDLHRGALTR